MLRTLNRAGRLVALGVVGLSTLSEPYGPTRNLVIEVVAFTSAAVTLTVWAIVDRPDGSRPAAVTPGGTPDRAGSTRLRTRLTPPGRAGLGRVLPAAATVTAVACALASLTPYGGPFSLLCAMATTWIGSALSLLPGAAITAFAAVTTASVGLAYHVSAWDLLGYPLVLVLGLLFGRLIRSYRLRLEQSAALLQQSEQLRREQTRASALDERNRIAREIHDLLAHSLGALGVQIQAAQAVLTDQGDVARAVELLGQARRMATDGLNETRRALHALRSDTPPLPEGLADLSASHQRQHRAPVSFEVTGEPRPLSPDAGLALTRTAQEALVNTAKHAPHQPVRIRLDYEDGCTALTVANPLCHGTAGPGPLLETANGGYGLAGLRERLRLIDGSLSAGARGEQWVVMAEVPQ